MSIEVGVHAGVGNAGHRLGFRVHGLVTAAATKGADAGERIGGRGERKGSGKGSKDRRPHPGRREGEGVERRGRTRGVDNEWAKCSLREPELTGTKGRGTESVDVRCWPVLRCLAWPLALFPLPRLSITRGADSKTAVGCSKRIDLPVCC